MLLSRPHQTVMLCSLDIGNLTNCQLMTLQSNAKHKIRVKVTVQKSNVLPLPSVGLSEGEVRYEGGQ